jgi:phytoene dehydrogenase-like protein
MAVRSRVAIVGGGPSGMTVAWLLARAGHSVALLERGAGLGGLWSTQLDADGHYLGENSCKVFQASYRTAPALLAAIGADWRRDFHARHDLTTGWLRPFLADCSPRDLATLAGSFALHASGLRSYRATSVADYLDAHRMSEPCRAWLRATALGGIAGTTRMTVWELFHRVQSNLGAILLRQGGPLHWNARPPNTPHGFVHRWADVLEGLGVEVRLGVEVPGVRTTAGALSLGSHERFDAVFLAVPPPALATVLAGSDDAVAEGFGWRREALATVLRESLYEHLGMTWFFDRPLPTDLPLGGHNVRRGWHPILVQHDQYRPWLAPPLVTAVVGSLAVDTDLRHHRLGTEARAHAHADVARILWEDERLVEPTLPEPACTEVWGLSNATQIVRHGPLPVRARDAPVYIATSLNGLAPYFTASLESAIQAGAAAARAWDPGVELLDGTGARPAA